MQLDEYNLASLLSKKGLNTLLFSDPYAKLCCTSLLARQGNAVYFDFDLTFSAYLKAGLVHAPRIDVYLPSEGKFIAMLKAVLARMEQERGCSLVIFDSINSFYTMYYSYFRLNERSSGNINHLLSVLLMLLVRQGVTLGIPVLATSMLRFRKEGGWKQSPASRRLLQKKSAFRFEVERVENELVVRVLEHENVPVGTSLSFDTFDIITALH